MHPLFQPVPTDKPKRLLVTSWGPSKVGRSHFALTFPGPVVTFDFDLGMKDIAWKFSGKELLRAEFVVPKTVEGCRTLLDNFSDALDSACTDLEARGGGTIVIDTVSALWQIVQKVDLQPHKEKKAKPGQDPEAVKVMQFQYADANLRISSLLRRVVPCESVNAVFICGAADIYDAGGNPTGDIGCHGWKGIHGVSQFTLRHFTRDKQFWSRFEVCRPDPSLEGLELPNPDFEMFKEMFLS